MNKHPDPKVETRTVAEIVREVLEGIFKESPALAEQHQGCMDNLSIYGTDSCDLSEPIAAALQAERDRAAGLEKALRAITVTTAQGQVCFRTTNGVPMGMPKRLERIARAALAERERK